MGNIQPSLCFGKEKPQFRKKMVQSIYPLFDSQSIIAHGRAIAAIGDDLTEYEKTFKITTTGDTSVYIQKSPDGTTWTDVDSWEITTKPLPPIRIIGDGYIRVVVDNNEASDTIVVSASIGIYTPTYCTPEDVAGLMQLRDNDGARLVLSSSTEPTRNEVIRLIHSVEDKIDRATRHAWREKIVADELYNYLPPRDIGYGERRRDSRCVPLKHRKIKALSAADGDKVEIWNGTEWKNYLLNYTEGRDQDFWMDYEGGNLFFGNHYPTRISNSIRLSYRFGEMEVPHDIRFCCAKMVGIDLMLTSDYSTIVPAGDFSMGIEKKVAPWQEFIKDVLATYTEVQ